MAMKYIIASIILVVGLITACHFGHESMARASQVLSAKAKQPYSNVHAIYEGKAFGLVGRAVAWEESQTVGVKRLRMQMVSEKPIKIKGYTLEVFDENENLIARAGGKHRTHVYTFTNSGGNVENTSTNDHQYWTELGAGSPTEFTFTFPSNVAFYNAPQGKEFPRQPLHQIRLTIREYEEIKAGE
ncbi:hypothetical protein JD969_06955 [Planctomycetota bacterium]|nr:hypothetical protein JD969_06955 [Planctomycetota bacterium]